MSAERVDVNPSYLDERPVHIECFDCDLTASLGNTGPAAPVGVVLIANDIGTARHRLEELELARALHQENLATLMVDVLTSDEQADGEDAARLRVDSMKLAHRICRARDWLATQPALRDLPLALVGEGGAGAAALIEASSLAQEYVAVVVRSAQPLNAGFALAGCKLPTLMVVDLRDEALLALNVSAVSQMRGDVQLLALPGITRETAASDPNVQVAPLVAKWISQRLAVRAATLALPSNVSLTRGRES